MAAPEVTPQGMAVAVAVAQQGGEGDDGAFEPEQEPHKVLPSVALAGGEEGEGEGIRSAAEEYALLTKRAGDAMDEEQVARWMKRVRERLTD
jgi:hypothetical protein